MAGSTSAPPASRTVLPFSMDSSTASSSRCLQQDFGDIPEDFFLLGGVHAAPAFALETGARGGHGAVHIACRAVRDGGEQFSGGRIDDVDGAAVLRVFPAAIDEQLAWVQLWFDLFGCSHSDWLAPVFIVNAQPGCGPAAGRWLLPQLLGSLRFFTRRAGQRGRLVHICQFHSTYGVQVARRFKASDSNPPARLLLGPRTELHIKCCRASTPASVGCLRHNWSCAPAPACCRSFSSSSNTGVSCRYSISGSSRISGLNQPSMRSRVRPALRNFGSRPAAW